METPLGLQSGTLFSSSHEILDLIFITLRVAQVISLFPCIYVFFHTCVSDSTFSLVQMFLCQPLWPSLECGPLMTSLYVFFLTVLIMPHHLFSMFCFLEGQGI